MNPTESDDSLTVTRPDIHSVYLEFQKDPPVLVKGAEAVVPTKAGGQYSYRYIDLEEAFPLVLAKLLALDCTVSQPTRAKTEGNILLTEIRHVPSGTFMWSDILLPDLDPQGTGGAITYFRRYCLFSLLGLVADHDDDAAAASSGYQHQASRKVGGRGGPSDKQKEFLSSLRVEIKDLLGEADGDAVIRASMATATEETQGELTGGKDGTASALIELLKQHRDSAKELKKQRHLAEPQNTVELPAEDADLIGIAYDDDPPF